MTAHAILPPEVRPHVDLPALADWMGARGMGSGPVERADVMTGGTQNILIRLTRDGRDYVFRRPPPSLRQRSNDALRREAVMLGALGGTDVPHPRLIASEPDASVLGYVFLLMEVVEGYNPTETPPREDPAHNHRMGFSYVEALAALAEVDVAALNAGAGLPGVGKPGGFLARQVPQWTGALDRYALVDDWPSLDGLPEIGDLARWLERRVPAEAAPGLLHGDCHFGNTMFRRDAPELAALIDWEMATVADPRLDLGWVMASWPDPSENDDTIGLGFRREHGFAGVDELVAHYRARTSRPLDEANWFGTMACFKLAVLLEGTFVRSCAGKAPVAVGERLHAMAVALLRRGARLAAG